MTCSLKTVTKLLLAANMVLLLLGVGGAVLGFLGLRRNLDVTAGVLSTIIGLGIIANGLAYILAVIGVNRFEKRIDNLGRIIDEQ